MEHGTRRHLDVLVERLNAATGKQYQLEVGYARHYQITETLDGRRREPFGYHSMSGKELATALEFTLDVIRENFPDAEARSTAYYIAKNTTKMPETTPALAKRDAQPLKGRTITVRINP